MTTAVAVPPPTVDCANLPRVDGLLAGASGPTWERLAPLPPGLRAARFGDALILLRHADGRAVLGSKCFTQGILTDLGPNIDPRYIERRKRSLLQLGGAEHLRQRRLALPAFKPAAIERLRPLMRRTLTELLDRIADGATVEAVTALTHPYPVPIICTALGVPTEDRPFFSRAADVWTLALFDPAAVPASMAIHEELDAYVRRLIDERRLRPAEDMLSDLIAGDGGEDVLSTEELTALVSALIMAGTDTTRLQLASGLELLARRPDLWRMLRESPELVPAAVDEITRLTPVASFLRRVATTDTDLGDLPIRAGTCVMLAIPAMNRDPTVFTDPDRFDVTRSNAKETLSFGGGAHYCLGSLLGKAELHEALATLTRAVAEVRPSGAPTWRPLRSLQGPSRLPVQLVRR
jgi:cytochrome P450